MRIVMQIMSIILALLFTACTVIQYHHHHDDDKICLLVHCDSFSHHDHHNHIDGCNDLCDHHDHGDKENCSLHLSETVNAQIDSQQTQHILITLLIAIPELIPLDLDEEFHFWPRLRSIGIVCDTHENGWSLRAPPCL